MDGSVSSQRIEQTRPVCQ